MQDGASEKMEQMCPLPPGARERGVLSTSLPSPLSPLSSFLILNALALAIAAVFLRCRALGTIPGFNGDEAWYGIRAWQILHGGGQGWNTPTGNPLNPLFVGPLALLHLWMPPSLVLPRVVALASGMAALAINWLFCRWIFDRRTAAISTVMLAVLPINIAFSRFAWDAGQSLAATLPVVYLALAAVRFPERFGRWIAASILAQAVAVWVHPTNVFVGAAIAVACAARIWPGGMSKKKTQGSDKTWSLSLLVLAGILSAAWLWFACGEKESVWERVAWHWGDVRNPAQMTYLYPRLFTGGTVYCDVAGSRSWIDGRGIDVGLFWACVFGSAWLIWINRGRFRDDNRLRFRICDGVLLAAWATSLAAFVLVAGHGAMVPGQERFAVCLIAPTVLLVARGGALAWQMASPRWRIVLAAATLAGWPLLADYYVHYFRFIEQTGGQAHMTFRAAPVEPKLAALRYILDESARTGAGKTHSGELWIVSSQEWIRWPIRYLTIDEHGVRVPEPAEVRSSEEYRRALSEGGVWFVEFSGTEELRQVEKQLAGQRPTRQEFLDFGRRPVICVLHAETGSGDKFSH
ncbi:MAG: hypothetical protein KKA28_05650 [Planctomycetes bacterium]|nr:hypothetical protein [Planctomycetota bacterium]MCG2685730.1 hypothetical protein [Planctomycetales bacterium]